MPGSGGCHTELAGKVLPGVVPPSEIAESAQLAGLTQTKADRFGAWQGSCLTPRSR